MRTTRIIILLVFVAATLFILIRAVTSPNTAATGPQKSSGNSRKSILGFVYYNPPFSLFPPNAAISLTDDNSTSFAARPAAFGPKLASTGLSGPLWVGSGFVEDSFESHGELGCSDIPGWDGGSMASALKTSFRANTRTRLPSISKNKASTSDAGAKMEALEEELDAGEGHASSRVAADDGTDNHFHMRSASSLSRRDSSQSSSHADIQSMQESAEIEGKVVLLMRGGCGFLEKVMWAQRRGAIAVIVGDNQRGGPLIQMFARGDEIENVTIPSVFTARTTAQLLSSLTQPGSFIEDSLDDSGNPVLKVQKGGSSKRKKSSDKAKKPVSANTKSSSTKERRSAKQKNNEDEAPLHTVDSRGWFSRLFRLGKSSRAINPDSRPPTSGRLDWVLVDDWNDEKDKMISDGMKNKKKESQAKQSADNFIIGVQDWRDPDLVDKSRPAALNDDHDTARDGLKTGNDAHSGKSDLEATSPENADGKGHGFFSKIFGDDDEEDEVESSFATFDDEEEEPEPPHNGPPAAGSHEGLWVTIIPTSGATPFFDTLLVLVVSPLVTLSVVYALLILRARIRRRRWRAPKSVVERLPVRTYHTVATSPSITPGTSTPTSSSPTTPLLQHNTSRPRPRSRTTTGIPESETLTVPASAPAIPTSSTGARGKARNEPEKGASGFSAEWRKYMGRQVECVVCLEEYIDGVSRVMSLPCGHEFHADCM